MSIMAPFYPQEAAVKGMSESLAGFVFGFYALIVFLSSPVFGIIVSYSNQTNIINNSSFFQLPRLGIKFLFISGVLTSGVCSVIFG